MANNLDDMFKKHGYKVTESGGQVVKAEHSKGHKIVYRHDNTSWSHTNANRIAKEPEGHTTKKGTGRADLASHLDRFHTTQHSEEDETSAKKTTAQVLKHHGFEEMGGGNASGNSGIPSKGELSFDHHTHPSGHSVVHWTDGSWAHHDSKSMAKADSHYLKGGEGNGTKEGFDKHALKVGKGADALHAHLSSLKYNMKGSQHSEEQTEVDCEQFDEGSYHVFLKGGMIGDTTRPGSHPSYGRHMKSFGSIEEAKEHAKKGNSRLSPGEKGYYGMKYHVKHDSHLKGWTPPVKDSQHEEEVEALTVDPGHVTDQRAEEIVANSVSMYNPYRRKV